MQKEIDINKVVRQHLEMEEFLCGFAVKGKPASTAPVEAQVEVQKESTMAKKEKRPYLRVFMKRFPP